MSRSLLPPVWSALGGATRRTEAVRLEGDPAGLLPSRLRAFDAMASAIAAALLAASELDAVRVRGSRPARWCWAATRSRRRPPASASAGERDRRRRTSSRRSRGSGRPPTGGSACTPTIPGTASGPSRCWDAAYDPDAVTAAIAGWKALDLEDALAGAGALGYVVRTPSEWAGHAHGQVVASRPLYSMSPSTAPAGAGSATGEWPRAFGSWT